MCHSGVKLNAKWRNHSTLLIPPNVFNIQREKTILLIASFVVFDFSIEVSSAHFRSKFPPTKLCIFKMNDRVPSTNGTNDSAGSCSSLAISESCSCQGWLTLLHVVYTARYFYVTPFTVQCMYNRHVFCIGVFAFLLFHLCFIFVWVTLVRLWLYFCVVFVMLLLQSVVW